MKITSKWIVWFAITALYIAALGAFACFYKLGYVFDTKLQSEMAEVVRSKVGTLVSSIAARPTGDATIAETDTLKQMINNDDRIVDVVYLNPNATIRWYKDPAFWGKPFEEAVALNLFPTTAVYTAFTKQTLKVNKYGNGNFYEMAFPIKGAKGVLAGVVDLQVSRESTRSLVSSTMVWYAGAVLFAFALMGAILFIFIRVKIINPISSLNTAVNAVSLKEMTLSYPERNDEIGEVAESINSLFGKVKNELKGASTDVKRKKETESVWWQSLLAVSISKGSRAMVVDHDNNIMFTNFELNTENKEGPIHLLDIFGGEQTELIEVVGKAMDAPGRVLRGTTNIGGKAVEIRAVLLPGEGGQESRTMIVLEPVRAPGAGDTTVTNR